jgi:hypothetical protein
VALSKGVPVAVLDRVPVDRIAVQAAALRLGPMLLSLLMFPFFAVGWSAAKGFLALRYVLAAVIVGFKAGMEASSRAG